MEPVPVTQNPTGVSASTNWSLSRSPRSLSRVSVSASSSFVTATPTAIVKALLLKVPPWVRPPWAGSNAAITCRDPPKAPQEKTTAEVLAQHRQVGVDVVHLLRPADGQPGRHHLIHDKKRAMCARERAKNRQETRRGRDAATRAQHRFHHHTSDLIPVTGELGLHSGGV